MIELDGDVLKFHFPEVHHKAGCRIDFQRTLRIPDDNRAYPLPPGLGRFPLAHVDDHAERLPEAWRRHGGVFFPMYQAEAMWLHFDGSYPCAIKIAAGKINAVSGAPWSNGLNTKPQDYVVSSEQPWLDGFNVAEGFIRQFVAMPLGEGFTAEEQITGAAEHGGLQIVVYPMKRERYAELFEQPIVEEKSCYEGTRVLFSRAPEPEMGLAPGGLMRQEIYQDEYGIDAWDMEHSARVFVHLANSAQYHAITGRQPPHQPPTAREYTQAGLPWFDYYSDGKALPGTSVLGGLASIAATMIGKGQGPLKDNEPVEPTVVKLGEKGVVREGEF